MCDCCRPNNQLILSTYGRSRSPCCTPSNVTRSTTTCSTTTQTDSSGHHQLQHFQYVPCQNIDTICFNPARAGHHQAMYSCGTTRFESLLRELLDHCMDERHFTCSSCCCSYSHDSTNRCGSCDGERQVVVSELMDLLERFQRGAGGNSSGRCVRYRDQDWHCGEQQCNVRSETQTLFEVLFKISKRKAVRHSYGHGHSHGRGVCRSRSRGCSSACNSGNGNGNNLLKRLVGQLLEELEGNVGCDCQTCHEYLEVNLRRVRRELRDDMRSNERSNLCRGCRGIEGAGDLSNCCERVERTVVYGPAPRRARNGNFQVGWNIR